MPLLLATLTFFQNPPTISFPPLKPPAIEQTVDLDKLSHAVAVAETSGCTRGVGATLHNCHGLKARGHFRSFATEADSHAAFKAMWLRVYGDHFPTPADAARYTGRERADIWLATVVAVYNR